VRAVAVTWSFGRESLCELLGMWARQTRRVPLVVWLDGVPVRRARAPLHDLTECGVYFVEAPRMTLGTSLATMRNTSLRCIRAMFSLTLEDAFLVLEDDDFYASTHAERTLDALDHGSTTWVGSLRVGQQWHPHTMPELCRSTRGPGPHAQWAMRFKTWALADGYPNVQQDDMALAERLGWDSCRAHSSVTYVRREHAANLSRVNYDMDGARATRRAATFEPTWNVELTGLEAWCQKYAQPPSP
jgi:hypothetical protein